jgi:glycosyltransferase involved in cell wall biosynthesis
MNITFLLRYWPIFGGGETVTRVLANKFVELGYGVSIAYVWDKRQEDMPFIDPRIKEYQIKGVKDRRHNISRFSYYLLERQLRKYIIENKTDIIINQWWPARIVYRAKKNMAVKMICCHHGNIIQAPIITTFKQQLLYLFFREKSYILKRYMMKKRLYDSFKYSDKWVMLSKAFVEEAKQLFHTNNSNGKICSISNPLTYTTSISEPEIYKKEKEILFVGRITNYQKRLTYIIDAWLMLQANASFSDWELVIVGDGLDLGEIKQYALSRNCPRVRFEGQQNPLEYYKRAVIFVMTSSFEGWGMTLLEAQQNACVPIVMDSFQSLHEIIQHEVNGVIVENNNIPQYVHELERLMADKEYWLKLALEGMNTSSRFSVENIIKQWESLFNSIM